MIAHKLLYASTVEELDDYATAFENECQRYGYTVVNFYGSKLNDFVFLIYIYEKKDN